jgi:hypothetical protein
LALVALCVLTTGIGLVIAERTNEKIDVNNNSVAAVE